MLRGARKVLYSIYLMCILLLKNILQSVLPEQQTPIIISAYENLTLLIG